VSTTTGQTLSEFEEVARAYNVAKEEVVDVLHFLHTIGEVAYFDDDPSDGLADRVFLVRPLFHFPRSPNHSRSATGTDAFLAFFGPLTRTPNGSQMS
jgi:hypothetical protein